MHARSLTASDIYAGHQERIDADARELWTDRKHGAGLGPVTHGKTAQAADGPLRATVFGEEGDDE